MSFNHTDALHALDGREFGPEGFTACPDHVAQLLHHDNCRRPRLFLGVARHAGRIRLVCSTCRAGVPLAGDDLDDALEAAGLPRLHARRDDRHDDTPDMKVTTWWCRVHEGRRTNWRGVCRDCRTEREALAYRRRARRAAQAEEE